MTPATLIVHLRINDAATGQPTPVRLQICDDAGTYYPPLGRLAEFATGRGEDVGLNLKLPGGDRFAIIDGTCEIVLPASVPLRVRLFKGIEYLPIDETITLRPGQMAIRFSIQRIGGFPFEDWQSADMRAHATTPHTAALEGAAEGLQRIELLATRQLCLMQDGNTYETYPNLAAFSGQGKALSAQGCDVVVNTFHSHPVLGSLALLNCHRTIFPLSFGEPFDSDDWSLIDWADQCHRKRGLVVWADPFRVGHAGQSPSASNDKEAFLAAILGKIDALELLAPGPTPQFFRGYIRLLELGIRLPLVGASAKESNRSSLGAMRSYANLREPTTYTEAVRAGRTFVTNGPLLTATVNGLGIGEQVTISRGTSITLVAEAVSVGPFERLEWMVNGQVKAESLAVADGNIVRAKCECDVTIDQNSWAAARVISTRPTKRFAPVAYALTTPTRIVVDEQPMPISSATLNWAEEQLAATEEWANTLAVYREAKWRTQLLERIQTARELLRSRVVAP